jgi:hypothetical protein
MISVTSKAESAIEKEKRAKMNLRFKRFIVQHLKTFKRDTCLKVDDFIKQEWLEDEDPCLKVDTLMTEVLTGAQDTMVKIYNQIKGSKQDPYYLFSKILPPLFS